MTAVAASLPTTSSRCAGVAPPPVQRARWCVTVVAAIHVVALALILTHADTIRAALADQHPALGGALLDSQARQLVLQSAIPHVVLAVVLTIRARTLLSGRSRARTVLTALLALQLLAHATLPITLHELPGLGAAVIAVQGTSLVFEVTALILMWRPAAARGWFAPAAG